MTKNELTEAADKAIYGYLLHTHDAELVSNELMDDEQLALIALLRAAFTSGARWSLRTSSELSPHIAKFIHMMVLLGYLDPEPDEELTDEDSSSVTGTVIPVVRWYEAPY